MGKTYCNNYPLVFIHGLIGWGSDDKLNDLNVFPYFGRGKNNIPKYLEGLGYECYTPSVGPFSSCWDRACIFWAWLFGGTVDFGKVHSKKYGHARYGVTYKRGAIEDLGKPGNHAKINLLGHSYGGPTVMEIASLFEQGSKEEREGTPADELSPLFKGGHGSLIHTVTTLSGVNNGTTVASMSTKIHTMDMAIYGTFALTAFYEKTPVMKYYDTGLQMWGVKTYPWENKGWWFQNPLKYFPNAVRFARNKGYDNVGNELRVEVAQKEMLPSRVMDPTAYYFAQRAFKTKDDGHGHQVPDHMTWFCRYTAYPAGRIAPHYLKKYGVTKDDINWLRNDGFVNLRGSSAPFNMPFADLPKETAYDPASKIPGLWYNMPPVYGDHIWWNNLLTDNPEERLKHYAKMADLYRQLPDA